MPSAEAGHRRRRGSAAGPLLAAAMLAVAGCAGTPDSEAHATKGTVVVGAIAADRPEWQRAARRLRQQLLIAIETTGAFADVRKIRPAAAAGDVFYVDGRIEAIDPGMDGASLITGDFGWGGAAMRANFRLRDGEGRVVAAFPQQVRASRPLAEAVVLGSLFGPHFNPLYVDDLVDELAEGTAGTVALWATTGALR